MESGEQSGYRQQQGGSTRWNPTAEQLKILRELYHTSGIRSPTADQIQRISCKLSRYGKIEGKNVFYWFQNHKARERQKKRLTTAHDSATKTMNAGYYHSEETSSSFPVLVYKEKSSWEKYFSKEDCSLNKEIDSCGNGVSEDNSIGHVQTLELFPVAHPKSMSSVSVSVGEGERARGREVGLDLCLTPHN